MWDRVAPKVCDAPCRVPLHGWFRDGRARRLGGWRWSLEAAPQGVAPCRHMRGRNSARERAAYASVPQLPGQCMDCRRWVSRDRLCVAPVGAPDLCGLCSAVSMVQGSIPRSALSASEEEAAIAVLLGAFDLIRLGFAGVRQP